MTEHDALLRRVWRNLDGIIDVLFSQKRETFDGAVGTHVRRYLAACTHAAKHARELAESYGQDGRASEMLALADRLSKQLPTMVPPIPAGISKATIESRTLQERLVEVKKTAAGNTKVAEVGYVDIACDARVPERLELRSNLPRFLKDGPDWLASTIWTRNPERLSADDIRAPLAGPEWTTEDKQLTVWVDVRVTPLAVGQLVRELKTLRGYAAGGACVLVAMPSVDDDTKKLLANEGFIAVDSAWLSGHRFA